MVCTPVARASPASCLYVKHLFLRAYTFYNSRFGTNNCSKVLAFINSGCKDEIDIQMYMGVRDRLKGIGLKLVLYRNSPKGKQKLADDMLYAVFA